MIDVAELATDTLMQQLQSVSLCLSRARDSLIALRAHVAGMSGESRIKPATLNEIEADARDLAATFIMIRDELIRRGAHPRVS